MNFIEYLQHKKYRPLTIKVYDRYINYFLSWLRDEQLQPEGFNYTDLLEFMRYCNNKGVTKKTVHNILGIVRHFCNYLISEGLRNDNPAAGVFIKGLIRKLPTSLLSMEEMEELYRQYSIQLHVDSSKKIMLGLMIYQGLRVGEIARLQITQLKIKEGKIFIKGTRKTGERLLNLHAVQIIELQNYLRANKFKEGSLFIEKIKEPLSDRNINNRLQYMFSQLKQLQSKVISAKQIRSSVITHWLGQHNLRQVQYMAGHKYVSSTERYQVNDLEDLQNELHHHHPMK